MAYTALQLITRALYLSQIVSRQLQTPDGQQIQDGLYLLNALLDYKSTDLRLIPYFTQTHLTLTANTEKYHVPNLLYIDSMTFNIGVVRYPMMDLSRKEFFATARVDDIANLPWSYRPERVLGGMDIYIYFLSGQDYVSTIWGKYALSEVDLTTDMSLTYDMFYIEYLRYSLAEYICSEWGATFPDESKAQLARMEKKLLDVSPPDLTIMKASYFNTRPGLDWQAVNLSKGWFPY
jgi:hypothetical protein